MARIRTIKPDFWTSEQVSKCSRDARLLFIGTWNFADDNGNLSRSPFKLKGQVFPHDDDVDVGALIESLIHHGLLREYEVDGELFLHIPGFKRHQVINRPSAAKCPEYNDSLRTHGGKWKGKEGKGVSPRPSDSEPLKFDGVVVEKQNTTLSTEGKGDAGITSSTWAAYSRTYEARYTVAPVRNAKINGMLKQLVARLGATEAPEVASWYVRHPGALYVRAKHPVDLLLRDAEGLRTEWATGRNVTGTEAQQGDRTAATGAVFGKLIGEAREQAALAPAGDGKP